jgi:hypothetical protein
VFFILSKRTEDDVTLRGHVPDQDSIRFNMIITQVVAADFRANLTASGMADVRGVLA